MSNATISVRCPSGPRFRPFGIEPLRVSPLRASIDYRGARVTAHARITQADMERAIKSAAKVGGARVIMRLEKGEIEVIVGESADVEPDVGKWSDDNV